MMTHIGGISGWLVVLVIANALAQGPSAPKQAAVCTEEDYAILAVALNHWLEKKPHRVMLRDHTWVGMDDGQVRHVEDLGPRGPDVPREAKLDFDSRNRTPAKIEADKIKIPFEVSLLSEEQARKQLEEGGEITFVSLPGLSAEHNRALLYVGTSRYLQESGVLILLGKDGGDWKVLAELSSYSVIE
jgi:hypothetical protein